MSLADLPAAWTVWDEADQRCVLAYRPDVFDSRAFPAPCLPTVYVTKGERGRRPGPHNPDPSDPWYVTLYLEPDVGTDADTYGSREAALAGAVDLAARFADGDVDYRSLYQVPREDYFAELDDLTGRA